MTVKKHKIPLNKPSQTFTQTSHMAMSQSPGTNPN